MPYKRTKRAYGKKKSYRRRPMRKRRMMGRRGRADMGHLEKVTLPGALTVDATGTFATFTANWISTGVSGASEAFFTGSLTGGANNIQFTQCSQMYREYYISSMKIEFRPSHIDSGNGPGILISPLLCGTAMDRLLPYPMAVGEFRGALDSKYYDFNKPFKRFYRISKYAKQKSLIWRSCADALSGLVSGGFNTLPNCQTSLHVSTQGIQSGTEIGSVFVTYYIRFHHRTRAG